MNWWMLRRKIHSSWLVGAGSAGVVSGIVSIQYLPQGWFASWLWLVMGLAQLILCFWSRWAIGIGLAVAAGMLLGLWRGAILESSLAPYRQLANHQVVIGGVVKDDADQDKTGALVLRLSNITVNGHTLPGTVRATLGRNADLKRGDRVTIKGKLSDGFGGFSGTIYRASLVRAERPQPGDVARQVRDGFGDKVRQVISEPAASLGLGYLLGQRHGLPDKLSQALQIAGLTHVVVASGYNLTILVRLARRLFIRVSKYFATLCAGSLMVGFMAITGASPSMARAGLVTGLSLLAWYYGRRFHPLVLLPLAAAVTLLIDPMYGWGDLGWQLSFAAFGGVMIVAPLMQRYFFGDQKPRLVMQILLETGAAFVVTLPIIVVAFGKMSNVAILANLLVLPFIPLAMLLTFITGVEVLVSPVIAGLIGAVTSGLLNYMIWVATALAEFSWAQTNLQVVPLAAIIYYVMLIGLCGYIWRVTRYSLREANPVE